MNTDVPAGVGALPLDTTWGRRAGEGMGKPWGLGVGRGPMGAGRGAVGSGGGMLGGGVKGMGPKRNVFWGGGGGFGTGSVVGMGTWGWGKGVWNRWEALNWGWAWGPGRNRG